ncbi:hypothetical protein BN136_1887 [Cronobacter universalis NCTC 9529]|nr:hypothetical protein BN136_1887 [Cronobacter universalis NCTC 9529]
MRQLVPGAGEGFIERLRIVKETTRNFLEFRVETQREIGHQHGRLTFFRRIERVRNDLRRVDRFKLNGSCRAAGLHPFIFEQVLEEVVAPLGRRLRPGHFQAGGDGIRPRAAAKAAVPAEALRFNRRGFGIDADVVRRRSPVGFAERMAACDQRHGLFIVHAHVAEGRANGGRGGGRIAAVVRSFRVNVDKAHFGRAERRLRQRFRVAMLKPVLLIAPVHVHIRLPDVFTPGAETKGAEPGVFQRHVAGKDKQVGPGDFLAIFLFHRPQQATRFIKAYVIRPGV